MPLGACSQSPPSACIPTVGPETSRAQNTRFKTSTSVKRESAVRQSAPATSAEVGKQELCVCRVARVSSCCPNSKGCCTLGWWIARAENLSTHRTNGHKQLSKSSRTSKTTPAKFCSEPFLRWTLQQFHLGNLTGAAYKPEKTSPQDSRPVRWTCPSFVSEHK